MAEGGVFKGVILTTQPQSKGSGTYLRGQCLDSEFLFKPLITVQCNERRLMNCDDVIKIDDESDIQYDHRQFTVLIENIVDGKSCVRYAIYFNNELRFRLFYDYIDSWLRQCFSGLRMSQSRINPICAILKVRLYTDGQKVDKGYFKITKKVEQYYGCNKGYIREIDLTNIWIRNANEIIEFGIQNNVNGQLLPYFQFTNDKEIYTIYFANETERNDCRNFIVHHLPAKSRYFKVKNQIPSFTPFQITRCSNDYIFLKIDKLRPTDSTSEMQPLHMLKVSAAVKDLKGMKWIHYGLAGYEREYTPNLEEDDEHFKITHKEDVFKDKRNKQIMVKFHHFHNPPFGIVRVKFTSEEDFQDMVRYFEMFLGISVLDIQQPITRPF